MNDEYKYLVANPFGVFLVRCKTTKHVNEFIDKHLQEHQKHYITLCGRTINKNEYQVRDLTEIPTI